jgi:hypothetical protein
MMFFNIPLPDIFHFGQNARTNYESHYERVIGKDSRNIVLLEPLEQTLFNLQDIRLRIGSRIEKEIASGTDMTNSLGLLYSADNSLAFAEKEVGIATSTISGTDPRPPYIETQNAYSALNQTKNSLDLVLDAITTAVEQASSTATGTPSTN